MYFTHKKAELNRLVAHALLLLGSNPIGVLSHLAHQFLDCFGFNENSSFPL